MLNSTLHTLQTEIARCFSPLPQVHNCCITHAHNTLAAYTCYQHTQVTRSWLHDSSVFQPPITYYTVTMQGSSTYTHTHTLFLGHMIGYLYGHMPANTVTYVAETDEHPLEFIYAVSNVCSHIAATVYITDPICNYIHKLVSLNLSLPIQCMLWQVTD